MILLNLEFLNIHIIVDVYKYLKEREIEIVGTGILESNVAKCPS